MNHHEMCYTSPGHKQLVPQQDRHSSAETRCSPVNNLYDYTTVNVPSIRHVFEQHKDAEAHSHAAESSACGRLPASVLLLH